MSSHKTKKFCDSCGRQNRTKEMCRGEALECKTRSEFQKKYRGSYVKACKMGWLPEITIHMEWIGVVIRSDLELKKEMRKYNGRTHFARSDVNCYYCLLYTSPSPRDRQKSRMPSSA